MFSSRKYSVQRHITNLHSGQGILLSYIDYVVGRKNGYYPPNAPPNFINMTKPELVLSPPKLCDVYKEELLREIARQLREKYCQTEHKVESKLVLKLERYIRING